jgi:hypothetical protein
VYEGKVASFQHVAEMLDGLVDSQQLSIVGCGSLPWEPPTIYINVAVFLYTTIKGHYNIKLCNFKTFSKTKVYALSKKNRITVYRFVKMVH